MGDGQWATGDGQWALGPMDENMIVMVSRRIAAGENHPSDKIIVAACQLTEKLIKNQSAMCIDATLGIAAFAAKRFTGRE